MLTVLIAAVVIDMSQMDAPLTTAIMVLVILIVGFRLAFRILPPWVSSLISEILNLFMRLVLGSKGRK